MTTFTFIIATLWFGLEFIRDLVNLVLMLTKKTDETLSVVITMFCSAFLAVILLLAPAVITHICLSIVLFIRIVDEYHRSQVPSYIETFKKFIKQDTQ